MAKIKQIFLFCMVFHLTTHAQKLQVGADRIDSYLHLIKGKKVAVIGNQTSYINDIHLVDSLLSLNINIIKIFSPEHGFRGEVDAGSSIDDEIDKKTNLPIISLYGKNKKPTVQQLKEIDVLIFDIQDVGARFYTYLSTLHYIMEAAGENNIPVILLDRPNPNIAYIDGPVLEKNFSSFVGLHPVPILYGMTIGEYAKMINGENWIKIKCDLQVIGLKNYNRNTTYNLPIKPSPNLPNSKSINLYPSLCLFEGTDISIGRGTEYPFQQFGSPYLQSEYFFIPIANYGSKNPKHKNKKCYGVDLRFQDNYLVNLNLKWLINCYQESYKKESFFNSFFDKLAGTDKLRLQIIAGETEKEIKQSWRKKLEEFKVLRKKYLIY